MDTGSGIYRNVSLVTTNQTLIDDRSLFVSSSNANSTEVTVNIRAAVMGKLSKLPKWHLICQILDREGKTVSIVPIKNSTIEQTLVYSFRISKPKLWSPNNPYLYKAIIGVLGEKKIVDKYELNFGIRDFRFDANNGFFLNGKHLKILGVCMHHDLVPRCSRNKDNRTTIRNLKAMGCNTIRTAHNPLS
jgi:beta-galactosidase